MRNEVINSKSIKLIGISTRTNNKNEMDPEKAKIKSLIDYFSRSISSQIKNTASKSLYCVYTDYESNENGEYTYFVGHEVTEVSKDNRFELLEIPAQKYAKFTVGPGPMPQVCIEAWMNIWKMKDSDFGGERAYGADFELYDERAQDQSNTVFDLYISLK